MYYVGTNNLLFIQICMVDFVCRDENGINWKTFLVSTKCKISYNIDCLSKKQDLESVGKKDGPMFNLVWIIYLLSDVINKFNVKVAIPNCILRFY